MADASRIPAPVIAETARAFEAEYTHTLIDNLFLRAGAPGEPPGGSKVVKVTQWLREIDANPTIDALAVLGRLLEDFLETPPSEWIMSHLDLHRDWLRRRSRVRDALAARGLSCHVGGRILGGALLAPSKSLADVIPTRDLPRVHAEFDRALEKVDADPEGAVTRRVCDPRSDLSRVYRRENLELPREKSLHPFWKVLQGHLGLTPSGALDEDLTIILGGLASIVDGVGKFRTHAGDAHGRGPEAPTLEPRHARLAVHAADTIVTFVLESWTPPD